MAAKWSMERRVRIFDAHLIVEPLQLVDDVEAAVHDEGVHTAGLGAETGHAVAALLRGAEFKLEERIVLGADDAEIVGHYREKKKKSCQPKSGRP